MEHLIEKDGEGVAEKFVTVQMSEGNFRTRLHVPFTVKESNLKRKHTHERLMMELLKTAGIAPADSVPELKEYKEYCVGGGKFAGNTPYWESESLQRTIGRDKPKDTTLAEQIRQEIHQWLVDTVK